MTETLFDLARHLSPRLRWIARHGLKTRHYPDCHDDGGDPLPPWCAFTGEHPDPEDDHGEGDTEADAIADWARKNGVRLWNEEGGPI